MDTLKDAERRVGHQPPTNEQERLVDGAARQQNVIKTHGASVIAEHPPAYEPRDAKAVAGKQAYGRVDGVL